MVLDHIFSDLNLYASDEQVLLKDHDIHFTVSIFDIYSSAKYTKDHFLKSHF